MPKLGLQAEFPNATVRYFLTWCLIVTVFLRGIRAVYEQLHVLRRAPFSAPVVLPCKMVVGTTSVTSWPPFPHLRSATFDDFLPALQRANASGSLPVITDEIGDSEACRMRARPVPTPSINRVLCSCSCVCLRVRVCVCVYVCVMVVVVVVVAVMVMVVVCVYVWRG